MEQKSIAFKKDDPLYGCFSNFHICGLFYRNLYYRCSEATYQSMKTTNRGIRQRFGFMDGSQAKAAARKMQCRSDWFDVNMAEMRAILIAKFEQNPDLFCRLLSTGHMYLIEDTTSWHDNFWGACYCSKCYTKYSENYLGKMLVSIRDEWLLEIEQRVKNDEQCNYQNACTKEL